MDNRVEGGRGRILHFSVFDVRSGRDKSGREGEGVRAKERRKKGEGEGGIE